MKEFKSTPQPKPDDVKVIDSGTTVINGLRVQYLIQEAQASSIHGVSVSFLGMYQKIGVKDPIKEHFTITNTTWRELLEVHGLDKTFSYLINHFSVIMRRHDSMLQIAPGVGSN